MMKSLVPAFIVLFTAGLEDVRACMGPHQRMFPTCEINAPHGDERTTIVYVNSGNALSSVTPGSDGIVTEVVDVEIGLADKPHYIVLSNGKPIIWRFTGASMPYRVLLFWAPNLMARREAESLAFRAIASYSPRLTCRN